MNQRTFALLLAAIAGYKSLEHLLVFGPGVWPVIGSPLALGAIAVVAGHPRRGAALIAIAALIVNITPAYRNHLTLLMFVALTVALFADEDQQRFVLRCQLSIMYGFAAVAKVWPEWLSGEVLETQTWVGPHLSHEAILVLAFGTIAVEAAVAVGVWSRWRGWVLIAAGMHLSFIAFTQLDPWDLGRLTVFAVLSLAVWLRATPSARAWLAWSQQREHRANEPAVRRP